MNTVITSIAGLLSTIFTGIFGVKKEQSDTIERALKTFGDVSNSDQAYFAASASAITSVYTKRSLI